MLRKRRNLMNRSGKGAFQLGKYPTNTGGNYEKNAFGSYLAKVYAFPDLTDKDHSMSKPAIAEYSYSGNQSAPELNYYWNTFDGSMSIQVANLGTMSSRPTPTRWISPLRTPRTAPTLSP